MSTTTTENTALPVDHSRASSDGAHSHGVVPEASRGDRASSFDLEDFPLPTGREEDWRFSPMNRLSPLMSGALTGAAPSVEVAADEQVKVERDGREDERLGTVSTPADRIDAIAWETFQEALVLTTQKSHVPGRQDYVTVICTDDSPAAQHISIYAEAGSESIVVLDHRGTASLTQTVEINVGDGAHLKVVSLQDWDAGSVHASS